MAQSHLDSNGGEKPSEESQNEESQNKEFMNNCTGQESCQDTEKKEGNSSVENEPMIRQPIQVSITDIELEQLKKEMSEYKDKYLRLLAEGENARKRLQKEKQELSTYAVQNVVIDFLHPLDNFENALKFTQQMSDEVKNWALGFQMILSQFREALLSNGITPFESEGKMFDPHLHEAVEVIETDAIPPGRIVEQSIKGYKMGDRTIRPARVKVAKALSASPKEDNDHDKNKEKEQKN